PKGLMVKLESINKYNLDLIIPVFLILLAEGLIFVGDMSAALTVHALNLIILILSSIYIENRIYPALMLLPLFRLLNIAMPVFFTLTLYSYTFVYAPMFIPIYYIIKERMFKFSEIGLTARDFWLFLPLAIATGVAIGWGEYQVLHPGVLVPDYSIKNILVLSITMIFFVGIVEEFVFRCSLQTVMEERLGPVTGLLATSIIFGFMHSGYHLPLELVYVSFAGVIFGLLFWLSKSLPVIALTHGITNIALFLVVPVYPGMIIYIFLLFIFLFIVVVILSRRLPKKMNFNISVRRS
ncbi:MAG: CPBP family intramembrane glutamic endopeptidase, partial [Methanotrichaceae archaeon]